MDPTSRQILLCGTDEQEAEPRALVAGPLRVEFAGGNLRYATWHGYEALRAISYLVRDENWGTYAPSITGLQIDETPDGFRVRYEAECRSSAGATLVYRALIEGSAEGQLVFDVSAVPDRDFSTNRCGFCILHPIAGVAGTAVRIEHVDGSVEDAHFPERIDPAQPFMNMRAITHRVAEGVTASCRMEGDAFEMEDQRNWTDASYKTYVRPLALPWPYTLKAGQEVRQTVKLTISGTPATARTVDSSRPVDIAFGSSDGLNPDFGLVVTPEETAPTIAAMDLLREIAPRHLILSYSPLEGHGLADLAGFRDLLAGYPAPATLEFVLPCRDDPASELRHAAALVEEARLPLAAIAVSPAPDLKSTPPGSRWPECPPLDEVYRAARAAFPDLPLGGGMFSYFTELNRKRPPLALLDFVTHTTAPSVHAADDRSVMETLEAMPFVTGSVRAIIGGMPYRIGPSSIAMRHNPYGSRLAENPGGRSRVTMTDRDPRQQGLFAAAWMIGYAAATASARLQALTLGALTGKFGVVDGARRRPAFHAAKALARLSGLPTRAVLSSDPTRVLGVSGGGTAILANITPHSLRARVPGAESAMVLDETTAVEARTAAELPVRPLHDGTVSLGGYGIAVLRLADSAA